MKPLQIPTPSEDQVQALHHLYDTTREARLRTRVQMILLALERHWTAGEIAAVVRESDETVRRWIKRYLAEGIAGLQDAPRAGAPRKVTVAYRELLIQVVRRRPRSLDQPYSLWTLQRLADYLAERTGIRLDPETVRGYLKEAEIVLSRPQHKIASPDPEYLLKKRRSKTPVTG
jgi:transposase